MNGIDEEQMGPQTFLYGCALKSGKDIVFNPEEDDFEHQLDLRMVCVDPSTKDELHVVEVEGQDAEGEKVKVVLAALKPSTLPSVCLSGFAITSPAVFRLKAGSGPIHISGQHLVMMGGDQTLDDEEEEEVQTSKKRPASVPALKSQKKMKMDDDEDEEDDEEESEAEETPVKVKQTPSKPRTPAQNGKGPKANTPAGKQSKTPDKGKGDKNGQTPKATPKTPLTPKPVLTVPELKAKMKGVNLPKLQPKFESFVKNSFRVTDTKIIEELWKWRQTVEDKK
ncbi:nucleophosmin isoform X2 [Coregonus clupeaformis]|uniref:nucleophosmin isoform X2 n=1 Tax=Coregonus clupeaformis TaxID=59861 RepID=UPI001BE12945|nr:nucleophosmin isoform X2 [Coregonus clupeaformis]